MASAPSASLTAGSGAASSGPASAAISSASLCFSTDLLFNLDDVRADCASGLAAHGNLVAMLKSRINLERTYAQELSKMARHSRLDETEHGTMKFALASLRAQYLNTSVQHQQLAKNLEEDVLRPIEALYGYNSQKAQHLTRRINSVKKETKVQEDAYRRDYGAFDKNFREASASFTAAMDSGVSSTLLEDQYHRRIAQMEGVDPTNTQYSTTLATRSDKSSGTAALKTMNNNKLQIAEDRIFTIATNLRKHVVFAASALANEQYDWQVISTKFESVDLKTDIHDFILQCHSGNESRVLLADMTVNDLCNDATRSLVSSPSSKPCRPLRKTCLEIRDISSKKIPFDYDGNQELLCDVLGTRPSRSRAVEYRQRQFDHHQETSSHDERSRLRIDCSASSTENDSLADSVVQTADDPVDAESEDKRSVAHQSEPQHDSEEFTPSGSPSNGSLMTQFTNHDHEFEFATGQTELAPVVKEDGPTL
uniref:FCH domain-containing protein n=1 Tax=Phytophthora ramorum TaxID=164328 RepID=H3GW87_PHYRM